MSPQQFSLLALSFPGTEEAPHFERTAFKISKKGIFATIHIGQNTANLNLSVPDQHAFSKLDKKIIYPIPNKWGLTGWTTIELANAKEEWVAAALESAYQRVLKKK